MSTKHAFLSASIAALAIAAPAHAQDPRYSSLPAEVEYESYEVVQQIGEDAYDDTYEYEEAYEQEVYVDPAPGHHAMRAMPARHGQHEALSYSPYGRALAYGPEERAAWLADCRALYLGEAGYGEEYYEDRDNDRGGLIGGLLGAVVGGVAGNRIAGRGDRLAGTLIGAGVGGIAGAAIGTVVDAISGDDDDDRYARDDYALGEAADYCEAYLARYEQGGAMAGYYVQTAPVMMVQTGSRRVAPREIVREEWVEVEQAHRPARRSAPRRAAPAPQGDKRTPIR